MSYILDALRRADAERERGHVPGLHAQGASNGRDVVRPPSWRAGLIGLGAGGAMVLLALAVWQGGRTDGASAVPPAATVPPTSATLPVPASPTPVVTPVAPPAAAASAAPMPPAPVPSGEPSRPIARAPATGVPATGVPSTARKSVTSTVATSPASPPSGTTPTRATPSAAAASPVSTLAELPEEIRRQLPALAVGGSAYSSSAASRFVIVNGQLFHEGDALAPGLVLEQIRLKSAVLVFKGYRYGISF